jgi:radical SAM protein with 4Fe4S-binding SPASM domain
MESRSVISEPTTDIVEVIRCQVNEGFVRMHVMPAYGPGRQLIPDAMDQWARALAFYEALLAKGIVVEVSPFFRIFRKLLYPLRFADSHFPCTAGREMLGVGVDGYYHLCHHFAGADRRYNQAGTGIPDKNVYECHVPGVEQREPCSQCWARHLCGGPCYHRVAIGGGPRSLADCREWRELMRQTAMAFVRLSIRVPAVMRSIAENRINPSQSYRIPAREGGVHEID